MVFTYDHATKIAELPLSCGLSFQLQCFVDQTRDEEATFDASDHPHIINAEGKFTVPGGTTGIVIEMNYTCQVRFAARPGPCTVSTEVLGGVLVSNTCTFPLAPSAFTFVTRSIDVTPALPTLDSAAITTINTNVATILPQIDELYQTNRGGWTVVSCQMIFFKDDNTTELFRVNLFDACGIATTAANVFKRTKV